MIIDMKNLIYHQLMKPLCAVLTVLVCLFAATTGWAATLVMVDQPGCEWCEAWQDEIGAVYGKTSEGKIAPLRQVDIHDPLPHDLKFLKRLVYTPTFVLIEDGKEIGRIIGYPGEDFFWGLLGQLIEQLPKRMNSKARTQTLQDAPSNARTASEIRG